MKFQSTELSLDTVAHVVQHGIKIYSKQDFIEYLDKFRNIFGEYRIEKARKFLFEDISPATTEDVLEQSLSAAEYYTEQAHKAQQDAIHEAQAREQRILDTHKKFFIIRENSESFLIPFDYTRFNDETRIAMSEGRMKMTVLQQCLAEIKAGGLPFVSDWMPSFDDLTYAVQLCHDVEARRAANEFRNKDADFEIDILPVTTQSLELVLATKHEKNSIIV